MKSNTNRLRKVIPFISIILFGLFIFPISSYLYNTENRNSNYRFIEDSNTYMEVSELWILTTPSAIIASPALGDIDNNGKLDVVIVSFGIALYALNGENGTNIWTYPSGSFAYSSPSLGDINDDGKLEVVLGRHDEIYAINGSNGNLLWNYK